MYLCIQYSGRIAVSLWLYLMYRVSFIGLYRYYLLNMWKDIMWRWNLIYIETYWNNLFGGNSKLWLEKLEKCKIWRGKNCNIGKINSKCFWSECNSTLLNMWTKTCINLSRVYISFKILSLLLRFVTWNQMWKKKVKILKKEWKKCKDAEIKHWCFKTKSWSVCNHPCIISLYHLIVSSHCIISLYHFTVYLIVSSHCIISLCHLSVSSHCIISFSLYHFIVSCHCIISLYHLIVSSHCIISLYLVIVSSHSHCIILIVSSHCIISLYHLIVSSHCIIIVSCHCIIVISWSVLYDVSLFIPPTFVFFN